MLNLRVSSSLEANDRVLHIQHRFYGRIDEEPFDTFLGLDVGANVGISLRYLVRSKLEINVSRTRFQKEYTVGASYALVFPSLSLRSQMDVQFFTFDKLNLTERRRNFFYQLALQSEPVAETITPVVNVGYDGYNERVGIGVGASVSYDVDWGAIQRLSIIGEYFPVVNGEEGITGAENTFAVGFELQTYGHHFGFVVSNSSEVGTRRLMLGTEANDPYFGFNIKRLF